MHWLPPAHDLMRQQHSAHLWVLVLAFINDWLQQTEREEQTFVIEMHRIMSEIGGNRHVKARR